MYEYMNRLPLTDTEKQALASFGIQTPMHLLQVLICAPVPFKEWLGRDNVADLESFLRKMLSDMELKTCDEMTRPQPVEVSPDCEAKCAYLDELPLTRKERFRLMAAGYIQPGLLMRFQDLAPQLLASWLGRPVGDVRNPLMNLVSAEEKSLWQKTKFTPPAVPDGCMVILVLIPTIASLIGWLV